MGKKILDAPCVFCGYNGPSYWDNRTHSSQCPWYGIGGGKERKAALRGVVADVFQERSRAVSILSHAVDDIDVDDHDLVVLCRRVELDLNSEHERALAAEEKLESSDLKEDIDDLRRELRAATEVIKREGQQVSSGRHFERAHAVAEKLVLMLRLYGNYNVDTRGPLGLIYDALQLLAPGVAKELQQGKSPNEVHERWWSDDE